MLPGTAITSRPCSNAYRAVISDPLFSEASTTTTASEIPLMIRFRSGKCSARGSPPGRARSPKLHVCLYLAANSLVLGRIDAIESRAKHGDGRSAAARRPRAPPNRRRVPARSPRRCRARRAPRRAAARPEARTASPPAIPRPPPPAGQAPSHPASIGREADPECTPTVPDIEGHQSGTARRSPQRRRFRARMRRPERFVDQSRPDSDGTRQLSSTSSSGSEPSDAEPSSERGGRSVRRTGASTPRRTV